MEYKWWNMSENKNILYLNFNEIKWHKRFIGNHARNIFTKITLWVEMKMYYFSSLGRKQRGNSWSTDLRRKCQKTFFGVLWLVSRCPPKASAVRVVVFWRWLDLGFVVLHSRLWVWVLLALMLGNLNGYKKQNVICCHLSLSVISLFFCFAAFYLSWAVSPLQCSYTSHPALQPKELKPLQIASRIIHFLFQLWMSGILSHQ